MNKTEKIRKMLWSTAGNDQEENRKRSWTIKKEKIKNISKAKTGKYYDLKQENIMK